ncbi:MAG: glycosyltransferase [Chloroflexi bacterium]|nr:MAG: glycosyltransferase [Chloroflexota bacterium]
MSMQFSVIIPTRNRPFALVRCLHSFLALDFPRDQWELIVVNDGGERSFQAISPFYREMLPLRLVTVPFAGPAAARNAGAKLATGEFLAFTDDDCQVEPDWLHAFAAGFDQTQADAFGGRILNNFAGNRAAEAAQHLIDFLLNFLCDAEGNALLLLSNNVAYRRRVFEQLGGFDETFPLAAAEDFEMGYRLLAHGFRQQVWPEARVWHDHPVDGMSFLRQQFRYGRGGYFFWKKRREAAGEGVAMKTAVSFYSAFLRSLRESSQPFDIWVMSLAAQVAYRAGQWYQRFWAERQLEQDAAWVGNVRLSP